MLKEAREMKEKMVADAKKSASSRIKMIDKLKQQLKVKKCSYGRIKPSLNFILSIAEKILKDELSNKEAQTKLVEKMLGDVKLN
jgi:F-type H+-transporting ATPase subunit b